jgi:uncharacterized membrane protein
MLVIINLLFWLHLMALAMGIGGGIAMSQVGPRLIAATPDQRTLWWPLATVYSRIAGTGLILLLITGPLLVWLKYGGIEGLNGWFKFKMALVAVIVLTMGLSMRGLARLRRGDEGGGKLMKVAGPLTTLTAAAITLAAVFSFH